MEYIICDFCGKKFKRKKSQLKLCLKHYCSISCSDKGRRKGKTIRCFICKKSIYKSSKDLKKSKSKKYFCSKICSNKWLGKQQRADNHPNWAGGVSSYKNILKRENSKKECFLCKKNDVRVLCVHHVDKNRKNNNIKNLIWLCRNCHFLVHNYF